MKVIPIILFVTSIVGCASTPNVSTMETSSEPSPIATGSNSSFSYEVSTNASRQSIWKLWTDPSTWSEWDLGLKEAKLNSDSFELGSTGVIVPLQVPESKFEVTEYEEGESYAITTRLPLTRLVVRRYFPVEGESTFRHDVSFEGPLVFIWATNFGPDFRRLLPPTMERISELAEQSERQTTESAQ